MREFFEISVYCTDGLTRDMAVTSVSDGWIFGFFDDGDYDYLECFKVTDVANIRDLIYLVGEISKDK